MKISKDDYNSLLSELVSAYEVGEIEPDEVTVRMLAQSLSVSERRAGQILAERELNGELMSRWVRADTGRKVKAYRKL